MYWNKRYAPVLRDRDYEVAHWLRGQGIDFHAFESRLLHHPGVPNAGTRRPARRWHIGSAAHPDTPQARGPRLAVRHRAAAGPRAGHLDQTLPCQHVERPASPARHPSERDPRCRPEPQPEFPMRGHPARLRVAMTASKAPPDGRPSPPRPMGPTWEAGRAPAPPAGCRRRRRKRVRRAPPGACSSSVTGTRPRGRQGAGSARWRPTGRTTSRRSAGLRTPVGPASSLRRRRSRARPGPDGARRRGRRRRDARRRGPDALRPRLLLLRAAPRRPPVSVPGDDDTLRRR